MKLYRLTFLPTLILSGCATTPLTLDSTHPASATAPESSGQIARPALEPDVTTLRTHRQISEREARP